MVQKEREKQTRLEKERLAKKQNEIVACTFKPKLNRNAQASSHLPAHERLYVLLTVRQDKTTNELKEEAELKECTFKPEINKKNRGIQEHLVAEAKIRGYGD